MSSLDTSQILYFPFDEPQGSTKAYDYSVSRIDGTVTDADFVKQAKSGRAIEFSGKGSCEIPKNISFSSDFTIAAYVRSKFNKIGWLLNFSGFDNYHQQWIDVVLDNWYFLSFVKSGSLFKVYNNGMLLFSQTLAATPVGLSINQEYYGESPYAAIDELQVFNRALALSELLKLSTSKDVEYYVDGLNFKDYGVYVSASKGVVDRLKRKDPLTVDWDSYHGEVIDLKRPRYEARTITLDCFIEASGKAAFLEWVNMFLALFDKSGTQRLQIDVNATKPLVYEVYSADQVSIDKRWDDDLMVGTFSLVLREPEPVKRVLKHIRSSEATKRVTITVTSTKLLNIYWGDGTHTFDISGTNKTVTHDYSSDGQYNIIVAGVIEDIEAFSTNAIVVWNKL